ncbi:MAG TPA: hypothetical protein VJ770_24005 [Stellaceae bacterium]|nr:hypothetical protein [Stellaceae bacterium]
MATPRGRRERRHVRDKAVIDHLVEDAYRKQRPDDEHAVHSPTTADGTPVEEQVRKEWDPGKGGLPTF